MDREEALAHLRAAAGELESLLRAVPASLRDGRVERWTPREVAAHLVGQARQLATEGRKPDPCGQPDGESVERWANLDLEKLAAELRAGVDGLAGTSGVEGGAVALLAQAYVSWTERLRGWAAWQGFQIPRGTLLRTALHRRHVELGARMVEFAGWEMPVQYRGIVAEHRAVRTGAGLFDVSHMGEVRVRGQGALRTLEGLLCNDPRRLRVGQALYTPMCREDGGMLDDLVAYRLGEEEFLLVVNAARREVDAQWVWEHAEDCEVCDASFLTSLLALQGPRAQELLQQVVEVDLAQLPRFHVTPPVQVAGVPARISRTGYTGEDGFEILTDWPDAVAVWDTLVSRGAVPCGLGARDTLRLEAGYLLYGQDADESTTPWEAGLGWTVKLEGRQFVGAGALRRRREEVHRRLCGLVLAGRALARPGCAVLWDGAVVGRVTSGTFGPSVERSIALAYLPSELAAPGTQVAVEIRDQQVPAQVVRLPFYRRPSGHGI